MLRIIRRLTWLPVVPGLLGVFTCTLIAAIYYRTDPNGAAIFAVIGLIMVGVSVLLFRTVQYERETAEMHSDDE